MKRSATWGLIAVAAPSLAYVLACFHALSSLDSKSLIQMRTLRYDAPAEPVIVPMPELFKDVYWNLRGREKVLADARADGWLQAFAAETRRNARETGDPVDEVRAAEVAVLVSDASEPPSARDPLTNTVWVHYDAPWTNAPEDIGMWQTAPARIAVFEPDGEFSLVAAMLIRIDGRYTVSAGDGRAVFLGRWERVGRDTTVTYTKTYEFVPPVQPEKAVPISAPVRLTPSGLAIGAVLYREEPGLPFAGYMTRVLMPHRRSSTPFVPAGEP